MAWMAAIGVGLSALSAFGQMGAGRQAQRAAKMNAQYERMEMAEQARRLRVEHREREGLTLATAAASGAMPGGSNESVLQRMKQEHHKELMWMQRSGVQRANIAARGGQLAARQATASAMGTLAGAATQAYSAFGPRG